MSRRTRILILCARCADRSSLPPANTRMNCRTRDAGACAQVASLVTRHSAWAVRATDSGGTDRRATDRYAYDPRATRREIIPSPERPRFVGDTGAPLAATTACRDSRSARCPAQRAHPGGREGAGTNSSLALVSWKRRGASHHPGATERRLLDLARRSSRTKRTVIPAHPSDGALSERDGTTPR